jgi:hypothetical protein
MPTATYIALANITLSSGDSEIVFSSIPATYRDLVVVANFQNSGTGSATRLRLNADTGSNYSGVWMVGFNTSSVSSSSETSQTGARIFGAANGPVNVFSNVGIIHIMDYSATDKHKTVLTRYGTASASGDVQSTASRWANTNAVTSVTIYDVVGQTFVAGSTFAIYGIVS